MKLGLIHHGRMLTISQIFQMLPQKVAYPDRFAFTFVVELFQGSPRVDAELSGLLWTW
jgi:hypothetical protein